MLKKNQDGAAAILTVIFLSLVMIVLVLSFLRTAITEQRLSSDGDLSARAFYATESGLEDAKRALREFQAGTLDEASLRGDECDVPDSPDYDRVLSSPDAYNIEYTCMLINVTPSSYTFNLSGTNNSFKVPLILDGTSEFDTIRVEWHLDQLVTDGGDGQLGTGVNNQIRLRTPGDLSLPSVDEWTSQADTSANFPSMLQVNLFQAPQGAFTSDELTDYRTYISPNFTTGSVNNYQAFDNSSDTIPNDGNSPNLPGPENGQVLPGTCVYNTLTSYACSVDFSGFESADALYYLQVTNLYRPVHVRVTAFDGGAEQNFRGSQATADVTAKAGSVYRRVRAVIDIDQITILPDASITTAGSLCKDFAITDNPDKFAGIDGTSCGQ